MASTPGHLSRWNDFFLHNPASRHRRRIATRMISAIDFGSVIDVGCGDGSLALHLKELYGKKTYGLEYDADQPRLAEALDGYFNLNIAAERPEATFDLVVATEVLEHIPDDRAALSNIRGICSGHLLITVPAGPIRRTDKHVGHVRHYSLDELRTKVEEAGFEIVESFAWGFPFHSLYKFAQDLVPGAMISSFGSERYGPFAKIVCSFLYWLFALNSSRAGCQLFLLAKISNVSKQKSH